MTASQSTDTMTIDTGDTVSHIPTGETWVVAFVRDGRLSWVGWPEGTAALEDCELQKAATDEQRMKLLRAMAEMRGSDDSRCRYAKWRLGIRESIERKVVIGLEDCPICDGIDPNCGQPCRSAPDVPAERSDHDRYESHVKMERDAHEKDAE